MQPTSDALNGAVVAVIDDDAASVDAMRVLFGTWGATAVGGADAEALLAACGDLGRYPDLIVADLRLAAGASGVDAVMRIRKEFGSAIPALVISGDTARSDALVHLAQGADVLVHEALWVPAVDQIVGSVANASTLKKHIIASHTAAEDCGRVAEAAGVKMLVLSHLVPPDNPMITDQMWIDAASKYFRGRVVVGKDLMEI